MANLGTQVPLFKVASNRLRIIDLLMAGLIVLAIALRFMSSTTATMSYFLIAAYALSSRSHAIQALLLSWLFTMINPGIAPEATAGSVGRYAVLAGSALSVLLRSMVLRKNKNRRVSWPVLATILLSLFFYLHSVLFSPIPDVSILKALSWTVTVTTLLSAWGSLSSTSRDILMRQLILGLVALLIVSLPLLALPLGYLVNGTGFQGVLNHPQAFGPTMGLLAAWGFSKMLTSSRPALPLIGLVLTSLVLVVLSEARTAGLAVIFGIILAIAVAPGLASRPIRQLLPGIRSQRVYLIVGLVLAGSVLAAPIITQQLGKYFAKGTESSSLLEAYDASRGILIWPMLENIQRDPWVGVGFGIASDPTAMTVERDPVLGLPTGASIEKGVMPLAVVEELGIPGLFLVALWLWMLLRRAARGGMTPIILVAVLLMMNLGESTLFSPGGLGLLPLVLLSWASTSNKECREAQND